MQETEIIKRIAATYPTMSHSQQRIADVILKDPDSVAFLNIAALAEASNVSDSTVTRFATFLGYTGYPALSQQLQAMVRMRLTTRARLERAQITHCNDPEGVYYNSLADDIENIKLLFDQLDSAALQHSVDMLEKADKIGIICSRSAVSLGLYFDFYLNILNKPTILLTGDPRTTDHFHRLTPADVVVGIGFSRYTSFTVKSLMYSKNTQIPTIAITDYPSSPLTAHADVALFCPTGIASHMDSFVAPLALIQAILRKMSSKQSSTIMENVIKLENIWSAFDVYLESED